MNDIGISAYTVTQQKLSQAQALVALFTQSSHCLPKSQALGIWHLPILDHTGRPPVSAF